MRLILVRHCCTPENNLSIIMGHKGGSLNALGRKQALNAALFLREEKIDVAYVSVSDRTKETAEIILKFHPETKVVYTKYLMDRGYGKYENKHISELILAAEKSRLGFDDYEFNGGESYRQMSNRILYYYNKIIKKDKNKTIMIVTHSGPIVTILFKLLAKQNERNFKERLKISPRNGSITIFEDNKLILLNKN